MPASQPTASNTQQSFPGADQKPTSSLNAQGLVLRYPQGVWGTSNTKPSFNDGPRSPTIPDLSPLSIGTGITGVSGLSNISSPTASHHTGARAPLPPIQRPTSAMSLSGASVDWAFVRAGPTGNRVQADRPDPSLRAYTAAMNVVRVGTPTNPGAFGNIGHCLALYLRAHLALFKGMSEFQLTAIYDGARGDLGLVRQALLAAGVEAGHAAFFVQLIKWDRYSDELEKALASEKGKGKLRQVYVEEDEYGYEP